MPYAAGYENTTAAPRSGIQGPRSWRSGRNVPARPPMAWLTLMASPGVGQSPEIGSTTWRKSDSRRSQDCGRGRRVATVPRGAALGSEAAAPIAG